MFAYCGLVGNPTTSVLEIIVCSPSNVNPEVYVQLTIQRAECARLSSEAAPFVASLQEAELGWDSFQQDTRHSLHSKIRHGN